MRSIRVFLTLTLLSVAALLNFAAALRGYHRGMTEAEALFNQRMQQQLELLDYSLPDLLARGDIDAGRVLRPAHRLAADHPLAFQWLRADGALVARSDDMPDTPAAPLQAGVHFVNFGGYRWHALVAPDASGHGWLILAERDDQRWRMAESIILPAVYPMLLALPLLGLLIWWLLGIGLRPVTRLAHDLEQREVGDLHALPATDVPVELQPLAASANSLLRRLEASFARERRFSADVAHELRTPLAALRIQSDNLAFASADGSHDEGLQRLQTGIDRLSHLVEQILLLNRVAPDQYMARFEPIALGPLLRRLIAEHGDALDAGSLDIELDSDEAVVRGDVFALDSMLRNLLANAIRYTPAGGRIRARTATSGDGVQVEVCDSGPGIAPELRERVFDRFYRIDGDRNGSGVAGCGLGLSIVKLVADLHGARIALADSPFGSGLAVRVMFPAAGG